MIKFRVFYTDKNWFGDLEYNRESCREVSEQAEMRAVLNKCFSGFGKDLSFAFRAEADDCSGEFFLVEQDYDDWENGVYRVTHRVSNLELAAPVQMSKAAIRKLMDAFFKSQNSEAA